MNRRALLASVLLASLAAACNGGSSRVIFDPPPPTGNFSNADLNGKYAFSMTGTEICANQSSFFARIGSFTADGNGRITGGVEDVNSCTRDRTETLQFTNSTYSIQADGRGTLTLTNRTGTTNYSITLSSSSQGFIIQTDAHATASGSFQRQNPAAFSITQIAQDYVFDLSGLSFNGFPESVVGRFTADGGGGISRGQFDDNEGGTPTGPFSFNGSYLLEPVFAQDGRGTAIIAGHDLAFYIVDATRLKFISSQADFPAGLVGDAFKQDNVSFDLASLNRSFAFLIGGASTTGPIATAGRFTADGAGNLSAIVLDENDTGFLTQLPTGTVTGSYTVDSNGLGGGTMTWTDSTTVPFEFVFYLISPSRAVFQETDTGITSDGSFIEQTTGPISNVGLAGDYAFIWTGVLLGTQRGDEEDFVGQLELTSASSNNATGVMDFNEFDIVSSRQSFNFPIAGALTLGSNPAARNTFQVATNAPPNPSITFPFSAYVVDGNTVLLVSTDQNDILAGSLSRQP